MCAQYSAASFIETINTNSLSMDADEFIARMVTAGVPDMQLMPQLAAHRSTAAPAMPPAAATLPDPTSNPANERAGATPSVLSEAESGPAGMAALPDDAVQPAATLIPDPALAGGAAVGGASGVDAAAGPAATGGGVRGAAGAQSAAGDGFPSAPRPPLPALPRPQVHTGARSLKTIAM